MNERIEKLAEKISAHRDKYGMYFADDNHSENGIDLEKFAELIVAECINALENNKANLTIDAYCDAIWEIKEHFGVRE